jgi:hypothetical protein
MAEKGLKRINHWQQMKHNPYVVSGNVSLLINTCLCADLRNPFFQHLVTHFMGNDNCIGIGAEKITKGDGNPW